MSRSAVALFLLAVTACGDDGSTRTSGAGGGPSSTGPNGGADTVGSGVGGDASSTDAVASGTDGSASASASASASGGGGAATVFETVSITNPAIAGDHPIPASSARWGPTACRSTC